MKTTCHIIIINAPKLISDTYLNALSRADIWVMPTSKGETVHHCDA